MVYFPLLNSLIKCCTPQMFFMNTRSSHWISFNPNQIIWKILRHKYSIASKRIFIYIGSSSSLPVYRPFNILVPRLEQNIVNIEKLCCYPWTFLTDKSHQVIGKYIELHFILGFNKKGNTTIYCISFFFCGSPIMKTLTNSIIGPGKGNPKQTTCRMNIQEFFSLFCINMCLYQLLL